MNISKHITKVEAFICFWLFFFPPLTSTLSFIISQVLPLNTINDVSVYLEKCKLINLSTFILGHFLSLFLSGLLIRHFTFSNLRWHLASRILLATSIALMLVYQLNVQFTANFLLFHHNWALLLYLAKQTVIFIAFCCYALNAQLSHSKTYAIGTRGKFSFFIFFNFMMPIYLVIGYFFNIRGLGIIEPMTLASLWINPSPYKEGMANLAPIGQIINVSISLLATYFLTKMLYREISFAHYKLFRLGSWLAKSFGALLLLSAALSILAFLTAFALSSGDSGDAALGIVLTFMLMVISGLSSFFYLPFTVGFVLILLSIHLKPIRSLQDENSAPAT